jgi:hypothetical protein
MGGRRVPPMIHCWFHCGYTIIMTTNPDNTVQGHDQMEEHYTTVHRDDIDSINEQFNNIIDTMRRD